ncbi:MAG: hypothetical protein ACT4P4_14390 [Betaproteobacteria bacterium]
MGNLASPGALIARWTELCRDPSFEHVPEKVELNAWGEIELAPRTVRRSLLATRLAHELDRQLGGGAVGISLAVLTNDGVRVADVAWASLELWSLHEGDMLFPRAPEICCVVCAPDGERKLAAFPAAGAKEAWLVSEDASIRYFDSAGEKSTSSFPVAISLSPA